MEVTRKRKSSQMDLINSSLWRSILFFSIPIALSNILQQLFNSLDMAVVSWFAGDDALAAVAANATVTALFINIVTGFSVGPNVVIAKFVGQGRKQDVHDALHTVLALALVSGVVLFFVGEAVADPLMKAIDTPADIFSLAMLYYRWYFLGIPFFVLYNFGAAILRSVGDTVRPLIILLLAGGINAVLNFILVYFFHMGVAGVAIATSSSNVFSAFAVIYLLVREKEMIRLNIREIRIYSLYLKKIVAVGLPAALQSAVFSVSNVCIQSGINSFGKLAVSGSMVGLTFEYFAYYLISSFSQAAVTFSSQNFGARKIERCKKIILVCSVEGMLLTIGLSGVFILFGRPFVGLYTTNAVVAAYALIRMHHVMMIEFLTGTYEIAGGVLRGVGYSLTPAIITVIGSVVFRLFWLAFVFPMHKTFDLLVTVYPVSWVLTATMMYTAYGIMTKKIFEEEVTV